MKWKTRYAKAVETERRGWVKWFAWKPVRISDRMVWLETIERRFDAIWFVWDYREIKK